MRTALIAGVLAATPWLAGAHEGHAEGASHWHATDAWGFAMLAVLAAAALWSRRK